ncbi:hypothetical protein M3Y94_00417600 [Aphelenchoides besseyi]|nr:hypothetical protein M3Y94_00417600 [Aphelenchoides besseyi]KAI6229597.1 hypothetical protein M3Y95_00547600 [Aphelenchoides besseyi]
MLGPSTSNWHTHGQRVLKRVRAKEHYLTCCNCCHIKTGTIFLGLLELAAVSVLFVTLLRQLMGKDRDLRACLNSQWKDCLNFHFSHSNLTLAGDYVVLVLLFAIAVCIFLLFYGICNTKPRLLLPHLVVQLIGLLCSLVYFGMYAWSYFYGDLYTHKRRFQVRHLIERLWLATILLFFSVFQCYLFVTVLKCSLYLQKVRCEQRRRTMRFEEVSNRVRLAKQNGLWRETSWGGGFQEYRGQYDDENKRKEREGRRKERAANRVQWNLQNNTEKSISESQPPSVGTPNESPFPPRPQRQSSPANQIPLQELDGSPKRAAKLAKQKSKSSSQDSGNQRPSPPLIPLPVVERPSAPPIKRMKKEKSSDSLLTSVSKQPTTSNPSGPTTKQRGDSDSPSHRNRGTHGSPHLSAIRRTSVDSTIRSPNQLRSTTGYAGNNSSDYMARSGNSISGSHRVMIGSFPTHTSDQFADSDMTGSRRSEGTFKARGMINVQLPSSSSPAVKKISITSKVPSLPYPNF